MARENMKATLTIDFSQWLEEGEKVSDWLLSEVRRALPAMFSETKQQEIRTLVSGYFSDRVGTAVDQEITTQFQRLMGEELVITDHWGKKEFYGSVEDYVKKSIDQRLFSPVDSYGKKVVGCSSSNQTWLEWYVKQNLEGHIENRVKAQIGGSVNKLSAAMDKEIKEHLENQINGKLADKIIKAMKNLGVEAKA